MLAVVERTRVRDVRAHAPPTVMSRSPPLDGLKEQVSGPGSIACETIRVMSHQPFPTHDGSRDHASAQQPPRKLWRTVLGTILIVIGVLAGLAGLSGAMSSTDNIDAGYLLGTLLGLLVVVLIFVVPGVLLLRRPRA